MKLRPAEKRVLWSVGGLAYLSGAVLYALSHWVRVNSPIGEQHHPAEPWSRIAHTAFTYGVVGLLGHFISAHILPGLRDKNKRRRASGLVTVTVVSVLILSAVATLYAGDAPWSEYATEGHALLGLLLPVLISMHARKRHATPRLAASVNPRSSR